MARAFQRFHHARFDLLVASDILAHDVAVLARQLPNVSISGDWSHGFVPMTIEEHIGLRFQVVPMTKFGGFLSDASSAELSYGKLQVGRKAIAGMVEARFFEEDELPVLLHQVLHETPRDLFDLSET